MTILRGGKGERTFADWWDSFYSPGMTFEDRSWGAETTGEYEVIKQIRYRFWRDEMPEPYRPAGWVEANAAWVRYKGTGKEGPIFEQQNN